MPHTRQLPAALRPASRARLFGLSAAAAAAAAWPRSTVAATPYTLRMSITTTVNSVFAKAALRFASAAKRRSNGQLNVEVYPSSQLVVQASTIDAVVNGVIDFTIISSAFLTPLLPRFAVWDLPFLCRELATGYRVLDGPIGSDFLGEMESKGILGLAWGSSGFKELETTTKAVVVPDDMRGLRIRILGSATYAATYQSLGAIPVAIEGAEIFPALQQRTVDGIDLDLDAIATAKYYTILKHAAMTHHIFNVVPLMGSKRKIDALPAPLQRIVKEEAKAVVSSWRSLAASQIAEAAQFLASNGVAFTEIQYPLFRKAVEPVYALVQSKVGADLVNRITRATERTN